MLATTHFCGATAPTVDPGPTQPVAPAPSPGDGADPVGAAGGGFQLAALQSILPLLGDDGYLTFSGGEVSIRSAEDEEIAVRLCALGARVLTERRLIDYPPVSFYAAALELAGHRIGIHSPDVGDALAEQLAATAEVVAAGGTLADARVRAEPVKPREADFPPEPDEVQP